MTVPARFDAIVIGAGFSGLYALHRLRELGVRTRVLEMAENVGGTWLFNRYPGARCDIESIEYSYSFSDEIQQEWVWTETMPAQPEIEAYLNFVADRLDLRRDISFNTEVVAMTFDEDAGEWLVETWAGETFVAPFVVAASGILSVPLEPQIPGMDAFAGPSLYTGCWPKEGVDLTGKRVGVIGTGSTGVQLIPVVARQAGHLSVFQRSPAYTLPWQVRPLEPGELDEMKSRYGEIRAAQHEHPVGAARLSAFSVMLEMIQRPPLSSASREEQLRAIEENGVIGALSWGDVFFDIQANQMAARLYGEAVARIVNDADAAAALTPSHPFGCKRPIIDQGSTRRSTATTSRWSTCAGGRSRGHRHRHRHRTRVLRARRDHLRHRFRCDDGCADAHGHPRTRRHVPARVLGERGPAVLPRAGGRRVSQPVHRSGPREPLGSNEFRCCPRTARGMDRRLHRVSAYQRLPNHRCAARRPARVDRAHDLPRGADRPRPPNVQFLVQRGQCSRQETDVHGIHGGDTGIPSPLRPDRSRRLHGLQARLVDENVGTGVADRPRCRGCATAGTRGAAEGRAESAVARRSSAPR